MGKVGAGIGWRNQPGTDPETVFLLTDFHSTGRPVGGQRLQSSVRPCMLQYRPGSLDVPTGEVVALLFEGWGRGGGR